MIDVDRTQWPFLLKSHWQFYFESVWAGLCSEESEGHRCSSRGGWLSYCGGTQEYFSFSLLACSNRSSMGKCWYSAGFVLRWVWSCIRPSRFLWSPLQHSCRISQKPDSLCCFSLSLSSICCICRNDSCSLERQKYPTFSFLSPLSFYIFLHSATTKIHCFTRQLGRISQQ